jgi:hypothetical protein
MPRDPFARFESSGGGWLVPIVVFVIGAVLTVAAIQGVHLAAAAPDELEPQGPGRANADPPNADPPNADPPNADPANPDPPPNDVPLEPNAP